MTATAIKLGVVALAEGLTLAATSGDVDYFRLVVIGLCAYASGSVLNSLLLFTGRYRHEHTQVWLGRVVLRVCSLGLIFFVLDTLVESWGEPLRIRTAVALVCVGLLPWALNVVTHEVLRTPGKSVRRRGDDAS